VFVRDPVAGITTRVSVDSEGRNSNGFNINPDIDPTGRYVAFESQAPDLVAGDENDTNDVFVRDLAAGITTRVSVDTAGADPNDWSNSPKISASGRHVAFNSYASDLVAGDGNGTQDVLVRNLHGGETLSG
jgi:TolB protein